MKNTVLLSRKEFELLYSQWINSRELIDYKKSNADYMVNSILQDMKENIKKYNKLNEKRWGRQ
jgi:hypothetical protein|tara:strand:+ start:315 stop:503 length:189 start_codon:yes stop_codon:yes gene_type:complete